MESATNQSATNNQSNPTAQGAEPPKDRRKQMTLNFFVKKTPPMTAKTDKTDKTDKPHVDDEIAFEKTCDEFSHDNQNKVQIEVPRKELKRDQDENLANNECSDWKSQEDNCDQQQFCKKKQTPTLYAMDGSELNLVSGASVLYAGTKLEAALNLNFSQESIENLLKQPSRQNRYLSLPYYDKKARLLTGKISNNEERLSECQDPFFACYEQTRLGRELKEELPDLQDGFTKAVLGLLKMPAEITTSEKKRVEFLQGGFLDLSFCEAKLGKSLQFIQNVDLKDVLKCDNRQPLKHRLIEESKARIPGRRLEVNQDYDDNKLQQLINTMYDTSKKIELKYKNQDPTYVLEYPENYEINMENCLRLLLEVYTQTFPNGVQTLEEVFRGVLACLVTSQEEICKSKGEWWEFEGTGQTKRQLVMMKLLSLVFGVNFTKALARKTWFMFWGSCLQTIRVNLIQASDKALRPLKIELNYLSSSSASKSYRSGVLTLDVFRQYFDEMCGKDQAEDMNRYFKGFQVLSATTTQDLAGFFRELDNFETDMQSFLDDFRRPSFIVQTNGTLGITFRAVKHRVGELNRNAALDYMVIELTDTKITRFTLQNRYNNQGSRIERTTRSLRRFCYRLCNLDDEVVAVLDLYTDTLIGPESEKLNLSELIARFSEAWTSHFNESRLFLALRCDLVKSLLQQKRAFASEFSQVSKYLDNESVRQLTIEIQTCPFYLDVFIRRLFLRALAAQMIDREQLSMISFTELLNDKPCHLTANELDQDFTADRVTLMEFKLQPANQSPNANVYKLWETYDTQLQISLRDSTSKSQQKMTASEKIAIKLLSDCLNPLRGPVNRNHFLTSIDDLHHEYFGQKIAFSVRLDWFVYQVVDNGISSKLSRTRIAQLQDQCIQTYQSLTGITPQDWSTLTQHRWPSLQK